MRDGEKGARVLTLALVVLLLLAGGALAQTAPASPRTSQAQPGQSQTQSDIIQSIRIEGTNRIEPATVRSYLLLKVGDHFSAERMDKSLKSLYATGLFHDVNLAREGNTLVVRVEENPIINRLAFEGNHKFSDKDLRAEVQLRPRVVYTQTKVQADTKRLLDLYRSSGRFGATVEPKVIPLKQNRVDLVFEIKEGEVTGIRSINFVGNKHFSDSDLRQVILTEESAWWKFFTTHDTYDPDRLTYDQELLRKFYLSKGYADFRNVSVVAELTPDRKDFFVTFTVEEGERYKFGKIDVTTSLKKVDVKSLKSVVTTEEGDWYNGNEVEDSITKLTDKLGTLGYAFVEVRPQIKRHRDKRTVDVTYDIQEGPKVFVERINITGNTRTRDEVIRREMQLAEGDAFNTSKIRESRRRIKNLDFFDDVQITNVPGSAPDKTIVNVEVKEKSTGQLSLGAGYSSAEGAIGNVGVRERNFLGRGQDIGLFFTLSQRTQSLDFSFTEPYFLNRDMSAGVDAFRTTRNFSDEGGFDQTDTGFRLRTKYEIVPDLYHSWKYTLKHSRIENIKSDASVVIRASEGATTTSSIGQELLLDKTDNRKNPTNGYIAKLSAEVAGAGGSERFIKPEISATKYFPLWTDKWIFSIGGRAGMVRGLGKDVGLPDRFFIGQNEIRGFALGGIGPRDKITRDALGANNYYAGSAQLQFPLPLPESFGVSGRVFADMASAFGIDATGPIVDESTPRFSAGVGLTWDSPFGPVLVDLGFPIRKESFDKTELFRFSFGTRF